MGDASVSIEHALVNGLIAVRLLLLLQGCVVTTIAWSSFREPWVNAVALVGTLVESAVVIALARSRGDLRQQTLVNLECVWFVVGLVLLASATTRTDRTAWVNWMPPVAYSAAGLLAVATTRTKGLLLTGVMGVTYLASVIASIGLGASQAATGIANTISFFGYFVGASIFTGRARAYARALNSARNAAIERGMQLATLEERNRQYRLLHDSALQTLEAIAGGWVDKGKSLQIRAQQEAIRLRRTLSGIEPDHQAGMLRGLDQLAQEMTYHGLRVEVIMGELDIEPANSIGGVVLDATREALVNVAKHAQIEKATVYLSVTGQMLQMSIRDHGSGFDPDTVTRGFGSRQSMDARIRDIGGTVDIRSSPGKGTRVRISVPQ